ncbi:MAG: sodium:solute symporter family protein [Acidimicrobiia bacterium]|nr:sodium:solute symporter family protein [Acidimicrobiia bacterium]
MHITTVDWIVLITYLAACAGIGIIVGLRVKDTDHYFLGKRRFGKWLMMGQSFGVGTHAEMPVSLTGAVYSVGASGIWYQWKNLFVTPFYWIMAPVFRRLRRTTLAEVMEDRYGAWMGGIYTLFALSFFTINTANMLKGAAKVIHQASGGGLGVNEIVIAMTAIFIVYSFVGGLEASAWTDFFQGFLIIILSFMLIPLGWSAVGGADGLRTSLESYKFSLSTPRGITPWVIAMLTINGLVGVMAMPHQLAAVGTGKDERTCRVGMLYGNYIKRFCTVGWTVVGLVAASMVLGGRYGMTTLADPEDAFGFACRQLLFPGGLGLMIAGVLAANMSTCSAFMVDSGALFTQGVYRHWLAKGKPDSHYLWVGRVSGLALTLLGVVYALFLVERVLYSFLLTETMATFMGISFMGGIVWQRANRWGAIASLAVSLSVNFILYAWRNERLDHWDANVFLAALLAGLASLVAVSLMTPPEPQEKLQPFFTRLQTPAEGDGSPGIQVPTEPDSIQVAKAGKQLLLVNLLHPFRGSQGVGFLKAYRIDLRGFSIGWALAIALVFTTAWLFESWTK